MDKRTAVRILRTWLRPSNPMLKVTPKGFRHTCKRKSTRDRFVEAVNTLDGQIVDQTGEYITLANLLPDAILLITPGSWGGSQLGSHRKKKETRASRELNVRLYDKHTRLLKALALQWYGLRSESRTIRRLIEEAAEKEFLY